TRPPQARRRRSCLPNMPRRFPAMPARLEVRSSWLSESHWVWLARALVRLSFAFVAHYLDVVAVRSTRANCIVLWLVVRAKTRGTIVFATRRHSRAIESFDLLAILGHERQVKMRRCLLGLVQAQ